MPTLNLGNASTPATGPQVHDFIDALRLVEAVLATDTALTKAAHANRDLIGTSALARTHTIAATGFVAGDEIRGYNDAAGVMTFAGAGFTITGSAALPPTVAQHEPFLLKCRSNGVWKRLA